jgi:hypothetical protein
VRTRDFVLIVGRLGFAVAGVVAITYQFSALDNTLPTFNAGNFFSFFTIQSNILAAALLVASALVSREKRSALFDAFRGAVTLYIAITGVVFAVLLAGLQEDLDTHIAWVDFVVHKLIPIVVVADWLIDPPHHRLRLRVALAWLSYPAAWLAYTLIRGAAVDWYPYPFVDVNKLGYGGVFWRCAVLLVVFVGAAVAFGLIGNARTSDSSATRPSGITP